MKPRRESSFPCRIRCSSPNLHFSNAYAKEVFAYPAPTITSSMNLIWHYNSFISVYKERFLRKISLRLCYPWDAWSPYLTPKKILGMLVPSHGGAATTYAVLGVYEFRRASLPVRRDHGLVIPIEGKVFFCCLFARAMWLFFMSSRLGWTKHVQSSFVFKTSCTFTVTVFTDDHKFSMTLQTYPSFMITTNTDCPVLRTYNG